MFTYIMLFLTSGSFLSKYTILRLQCFISPSAYIQSAHFFKWCFVSNKIHVFNKAYAPLSNLW